MQNKKIFSIPKYFSSDTLPKPEIFLIIFQNKSIFYSLKYCSSDVLPGTEIFSSILVTLTQQNFASAQDSYICLYKKFQVFSTSFMCSFGIMMNWKKTPTTNCEVLRVVCFLTIQNNSEPKFTVLQVLTIEKRM